MSGVARNSALNLATRVLAVCLVLGITLYTARLGTEQQGAFALFVAMEGMLLALMSGFGVAIARRISHHGETAAGLVSATVVVCLAIGLMASLLLAAIAPTFHRDVLLSLALVAPMLFVTANLTGVWLGRGHMGALSRITLAVPLLCLSGIVLCRFIGLEASLVVALWAWVAARWLAGVAVLVAAHRADLLIRPDGSALLKEARWVMLIGLTNVVGLLNYKVDLFLVEKFLGLQSTGIYSIAVMVAESLWLVSSSITAAVYARIGTPDAAQAARLTIRSMHASALMLAALSVPLWLAAAVLIPWLLGESYRSAILVLAVLVPGVVLFGAGSALSAWFTNHAGRPLIPAMLALLSLCINVVISIALIPSLGMLGAALATSFSYAMAIALGLYLFARACGMPLGVLIRPDWRCFLADARKLKSALFGR